MIIGNHWYFAAQILDKSLVRPLSFYVRDCNEELVELTLDLDEASLPNRKHLNSGNTVCVMYAKRGLFDVSDGVRVKESRSVQGQPICMSGS